MRCEVIVVGAGPAGSTVARELAKRGVSVVMLDKEVFPRDKPCGGAVSIRCESQIDLDLSPVIERTVHEACITLNRRPNSELRRPSSEPFGHLTQRRRLDALLAENAMESGAVFRQRARIRSVEINGADVTVRTADEVFHGKVVVGADGANGVTARMSGIGQSDHHHSVALEGNISPKDGVPEKWGDAIGIDFGAIDGGYGWVLPKGDHLNIGLGGYKHVGPNLRAELRKLVRFYGQDPDALWGIRGHRLPLRRETSAVVNGNVVLVGDAAGLLDPLTGEGIFAAVRSAQIAAECITGHLAGDNTRLESYPQELEADILSDNRVSTILHNLFYLWPGMFFRLERTWPTLWHAMVAVFRGDATYMDLSRISGLLWPALRTASGLIHTLSPQRS